MFNPSRDDVRQFFCSAWRKRRDGSVMTPLELVAAKWIELHPEYHALLDEGQAALTRDFSIERGESNPFLHLSMHLAIDEQLSIDQPAGIRDVFAQLAARSGDAHEAAHQTMECLGEIVWRTQRAAMPADAAEINALYLECLRRRLGQ